MVGLWHILNVSHPDVYLDLQMWESFSLTHHFIVKIHTYHQGNMFQPQGAIIRPLYKNRSLPDKDLFLYRGLMMAPCSWNMLPWWYVCILTIIKWCVILNNSHIYEYMWQILSVGPLLPFEGLLSREYSKGNKTVPGKVATTHTEDGHKQDT